jgi:hypothetical protein
MSTKKYEQLIKLLVNEDTAAADQLFHEIIVDASRQIYEGLMDEEGGLMDEINSEEESGMAMEDGDEFGDEMTDEPMGDEFGDEESMDDMGGEESMDDMGGEFGGEEMDSEEVTKDDIMNLEDKLDQLMAEFEAEFGADDEEGEAEFGGDEESMDDMDDMDDEEGEEEGEEGESGVMEGVEMKKVSVSHTDGSDSSNKRSPTAFNSGKKGMEGTVVKFAGSPESVPTSAKKPSNYGSKGETQVPHAGQFKNVPAQTGMKMDKAPAPVKKDAAPGTKSPISESRKTVAKRTK